VNVHPSHPTQVLYAGQPQRPAEPVCDHYCGGLRHMEKALELQAAWGPVFDVTLDLEDGAAAGREREQLDAVLALVRSDRNAHDRVGVRVHGPHTPWWRLELATLACEAGSRLSHLTLPKAESAAEVAEVLAHLRRAASACSLERPIPVRVLIETHGALREAEQIAGLPWMAGLEFGLMDFISAHEGAIPLEALRSPLQFEHPLVVRAKTAIAAAALGHGLVPSHNVTVDLEHPQQAGADAQRARRELGFLRMWSIHPSQIEPIVAAFAPQPAELDEACAVLTAAADASWGPVKHAGRLHDAGSYRYHWQVLQRAHATGQALPDATRERFFAD
jgi:citrate lyase subunit beta / citryl-CoA lyase